SQINKILRSSKRIKEKYQKNICTDEQDNEFSDENQQEESISNDPDNNEEMDVSMSANDNDEPSYNISNQNSDIEQEGSNRNNSDSPERSEIESLNKLKRKTRYSMRFQKNGPSYNVSNQDSDIEQESHNRNEPEGVKPKTRYSERLHKKRELDHKNDRNTKKKKPNASLEISSNFDKARKVFSFLMILGFIMFAFAHSLHLLLRPAVEISLDHPSYSSDTNNPWNLATAYKFIFLNGTINENISITKPPDSDTNMFTRLNTAILAVYIMITGDSTPLSPWVLDDNACLILTKIELFYMLPFQRRKQNWFPYIIFYEVHVNKLREFMRKIQNGSWTGYKSPFFDPNLLRTIPLRDKVDIEKMEKTLDDLAKKIEQLYNKNKEKKETK
ncbi:35436_t:CDS:2, partial [Racocetra persica]